MPGSWVKSSKPQKKRKKKERKEKPTGENKQTKTKSIEMHFHKIETSCNAQIISNNPKFKGLKKCQPTR